MAVKHLITWGIGYTTSGDYPLFLVTHGLTIGVAAAVVVAVGPEGERLTANFVLLRRHAGTVAVLRRHTATGSLLRRVTRELTR